MQKNHIDELFSLRMSESDEISFISRHSALGPLLEINERLTQHFASKIQLP